MQASLLSSRTHMPVVLAWIVLLASTGCGGSDPLSSPETQGPVRSFRYLPAADVEAYIAVTRSTISALNRVRDEFGAITTGWTSDKVTAYWTRQFTANLMKRAEDLQSRVKSIRPEAPELLDIHMAYEEAVAAYLEAFQQFLDQMDIATPQSVEDVNAMLYRGNYLMDRYQLRLSNLLGQQVTF